MTGVATSSLYLKAKTEPGTLGTSIDPPRYRACGSERGEEDMWSRRLMPTRPRYSRDRRTIDNTECDSGLLSRLGVATRSFPP